MSDSQPPTAQTAASVVDAHDLHFDPAGGPNGSLYVGYPRGGPETEALEPLVTRLRAASLWSDQASKPVPESHRDAYREQLELVEVVGYRGSNGLFSVARFDHPKFPSDPDRWSAWLTFFDEHFERGAGAS